jgi:hypothetical protein
MGTTDNARLSVPWIVHLSEVAHVNIYRISGGAATDGLRVEVNFQTGVRSEVEQS